MQLAYKMFYQLFDTFSYIKIPRDARDFSLVDRRVAEAMLRFPERDLFLQGYAPTLDFARSVLTMYEYTERMFGRKTNSLLKILGWAKKGILSFSYVPLDILSSSAIVLLRHLIADDPGTIAGEVAFPSARSQGLRR